MSALAVIGSRGFRYLETVVPYGIDQYVAGVTSLVSGGARGVDRIAEAYGKGLGLKVISYRPRKDRRFGYVVDKWVGDDNIGPVRGEGGVLTFDDFSHASKSRNWWIVRDGDRTLAFWDGMSSGTAHGIAAATRVMCPLRIWMDGDS